VPTKVSVTAVAAGVVDVDDGEVVLPPLPHPALKSADSNPKITTNLLAAQTRGGGGLAAGRVMYGRVAQQQRCRRWPRRGMASALLLSPTQSIGCAIAVTLRECCEGERADCACRRPVTVVGHLSRRTGERTFPLRIFHSSFTSCLDAICRFHCRTRIFAALLPLDPGSLQIARRPCLATAMELEWAFGVQAIDVTHTNA
jgi:hypothetical protein